ncbi:hypothetical protein H1R20_g13148, partial [Candolleomyces eurysporus]
MAELDLEYLTRVDAKSMFGNLCLSLIVVGIHLFMAIYGLSVFLETRDDLKKGRRLYIVISFIITGLASLNASLEAAWVFKLIFESTSPLDYLDHTVDAFNSWEQHASFASITAMVYRCYIIWKDHWWVSIPPTLTCLTALALGIFDGYKKMPNVANDSARYTSAVTILTVSTNVMVTSMILFYLIRARRGLSKVLPSRDLKLYTGVVALLLESALPLAIFGIMYATVIMCTPKETNSANAAYISFSYVMSFLFYAFTVSLHLNTPPGLRLISRFKGTIPADDYL